MIGGLKENGRELPMKRTSPEVRVGSKTVLTPLKWDVCITPSKADIGQLRCRYVIVCYGAAKASAYNDAMCAEDALKGIVGKRLMYRRPDEAKVS